VNPERKRGARCAIYTRKSSEEGLEQAFNSLDAQREACEAYVRSQKHEGWQLIRTHYDDGGLSGGNLERPAMQHLLDNIRGRKIDTVVVYKVDRLTRSLSDFAKIVEVFDGHGVSFVSVTQQFNTTTSMGRLTLNMLLSFAQFEREVTGERIRDKIAASKKKGMWMGGFVPLGYRPKDRSLIIDEDEAETVRTVFALYLQLGNVRRVKNEADRLELKTKLRPASDGRMRGCRPLSRGYIYKLLSNPLYVGRIAHKGETYDGQHAAIIDQETWEAVQAKLASNAQDRRAGVGVSEPSLLAGLIYDEHDDRLTPSHAVKNGVRYRYYVGRPDDGHGNEGVDIIPVLRLPGPEIEDVVECAIIDLLRNAAKLIDESASNLTPSDQGKLLTAARRQADRWHQTGLLSRRKMLGAILRRVVVSAKAVRIDLDRSAIVTTLLGRTPGDRQDDQPDTSDGDLLSLHIATRLARSSGAVRLVISNGSASGQPPRRDPVLIKALIRAHGWKDRLLSGEAPSIRSIAKEENLNETYVGRILRLAFLAPDITEAILDGRQPADLELDKLMKSIPVAWSDQRRLYRFDPAA
jgi:site-specific DNA recombinase